MSNKATLVSVFVSVVLFAAGSYAKEFSARENFYIKSGEANSNGKDVVSFGYRQLGNDGVLQKLRFETNISYDDQNEKKGALSNTKIISNFIYHIKGNSEFKPYMGFGTKISHIETDRSFSYDTSNNSDNRQSYHAMTGFSYEPEKHPDVAISVGYSYSAEVKDSSRNLPLAYDGDPKGHSVSAKFKIGF